MDVRLHLQDLFSQDVVELDSGCLGALCQRSGVLGHVHLAQVVGLLCPVQRPHPVVVCDALHHGDPRPRSALQGLAQEGGPILEPTPLQERCQVFRGLQRGFQVLEVRHDAGDLLLCLLGVDHFEDFQLAREVLKTVVEDITHSCLGQRRCFPDLHQLAIEGGLLGQAVDPKGVAAESQANLILRGVPWLQSQHGVARLQQENLTTDLLKHPSHGLGHFVKRNAVLQVHQRGGSVGVELQHGCQRPRVWLRMSAREEPNGARIDLIVGLQDWRNSCGLLSGLLRVVDIAVGERQDLHLQNAGVKLCQQLSEYATHVCRPLASRVKAGQIADLHAVVRRTRTEEDHQQVLVFLRPHLLQHLGEDLVQHLFRPLPH
mmetsp:Transcript_77971/g.215590  ORF Transcript_77971/g.215590 Transcript_77971/m.215590 type:complete len:374 (-) Transcript_77971:248-1369(-)